MKYRFALAGDPVAHSLSPAMHTAALRATGLEGSYELVRCDADGFRDLVGRLGGGEFAGLNVTMPYKGIAHEVSDRVTPEAEAAASVNTMRSTGGSIHGHSSDVVAFREAFAVIGRASRIVLMGTGGSARAALAAFDGEVLVWGRNPERVEAFVAANSGAALATLPPDYVLVNCTPLGMRGEVLPDGLLESAAGVIDLPYGPGETPAVTAARHAGIPVVDGLWFLAVQAAESFRWWTGVEVGVDTMVDAARNG
ncbi:MAG: shikimate dehydrogenase family protein [Acidimicrobiia bacterium]